MRSDGVEPFGVEALWMFNANEHRFEVRKMIQQRRNGVVATQGPPKPAYSSESCHSFHSKPATYSSGK